MEQNAKVRRRRRLLKILTGLLILLAVAGMMSWFFPQQVLTVDNGPVRADVMVVLGGGMTERPQRAAELFQQDEAPLVICSGYGDAQAYKTILIQNRVPAEAISLEDKSHTTRENAEFTILLLRSLGAHRVIIVTSWFHSRRALACFEHYAPDIKFYSRPSYEGYWRGPHGGGRRTEDGQRTATPHPTLSPVEAERVRVARKAEWRDVRGYVKSEYWKLLGYWVCYGVEPF